MGILHRFDRVFRRKSAHHQGQLTIGCGLDGKTIDPQHVLRSVRTAAVYFHDKLDVLHGPFPFLNRPGLKPVLPSNMNTLISMRLLSEQSLIDRVMTQTSPRSDQYQRGDNFQIRLTYFRRAERARKGAYSTLMLGLSTTIVKLRHWCGFTMEPMNPEPPRARRSRRLFASVLPSCTLVALVVNISQIAPLLKLPNRT